jgi:peptide/nickel transport system substrate-binding protein
MSPTVAIVMLVVVILIVGGAGYAALSSISTSPTSTVSTCVPPTSPTCTAAVGGNDVTTFVPYSPAFGHSVLSIDQGSSFPVTVSSSAAATEFEVLWGDGVNTTGTTPTLTHVYSNLGSYIVSAEALVKGVWHTGTHYLYPVTVSPSLLTSTSGEYPTLATTLTNGSTAATQFGWLKGSGTISVSATYSAQPPNPLYVTETPSISSTGGTQVTNSPTANGASASYSFAAPGDYQITFVGPVKDTATGAVLYQNYTWTVVVTPSTLAPGCGQCSSRASSTPATSPHPGLLTDYETVPAGGTSVDPAFDYETVGAEMIYNVYQTLITYNGSSTATFIPQLATCVPGSSQCVQQYGSNLTTWNNSLGGVEYWTFVIDKGASFYDPATKASWGVYPSDVEYSIIRTLAFSDLPVIESTAGWILAQALLPAGNIHWDVSSVIGAGIHYPFNNTPSNVLGSMLINDSTYCPASAMTGEHGCITFKADGPGAQNGVTAPRVWPNFLQFISDPLGGGVTPSGWFNDQGLGAAVPGWPTTPAAHGDGPTQPTTTVPAPTAWDALDEQMFLSPDINPTTRFAAVASGPYYLVAFNPSVGYTLQANPVYVQPSGCVGQTWCEPAAGKYAASVEVFWESSDTPAIQKYLAGQTDMGAILPSDTPTLLALVAQGKLGVFTADTLSIFFFNYAETFDVAAAAALDPFTLNIPSTFFSSEGVRAFVSLSFPYTTNENTLQTVDGIQYYENYGGSIPIGMGNYYPENVSFPSTDPVANPAIVGSAGWWWAQMNNPSSPYYNSYVATNCKASSPCEFPIIGELGDPPLDEAIQLWIHEISTISGGAFEPNTFDLSFGELYVVSVSSAPSTIPFPFYTLGWAPDYPDPSDYVPTMWINGSYGGPDAVAYTFSEPAYNSPSCGHLNDLWYWSNVVAIPDDCQGVAFETMEHWNSVAALLAPGPQRILDYNGVEHIGNLLNLQVNFAQQEFPFFYAPWINPATLNTNPMWAGDALFYEVQGNGVIG